MCFQGASGAFGVFFFVFFFNFETENTNKKSMHVW